MNITIGILFKKIMKKWLVVAVIAVLMGGLGYIYSLVVTPEVYIATATSSLKYSSSDNPVSEGDFGRFMLLLDTELFSEYFANYMDEQGDAGVDMSSTKGSIDIEMQETMKYSVEEVVVTVKYTSTYDNAEDAYLIVTHFTKVLEKYLIEVPVYDTTNFAVSNININPKNTVNLNDQSSKLTILGLALGLVLSIIYIISYGSFNRGLKTVCSFKEEFDIQVLGTINYDNDENSDERNVKLDYGTKGNTPEDKTPGDVSCACQKEDKDER